MEKGCLAYQMGTTKGSERLVKEDLNDFFVEAFLCRHSRRAWRWMGRHFREAKVKRLPPRAISKFELEFKLTKARFAFKQMSPSMAVSQIQLSDVACPGSNDCDTQKHDVTTHKSQVHMNVFEISLHNKSAGGRERTDFSLSKDFLSEGFEIWFLVFCSGGGGKELHNNNTLLASPLNLTICLEACSFKISHETHVNDFA